MRALPILTLSLLPVVAAGCHPFPGGCCAIEPGIRIAAVVADAGARGEWRHVSGVPYHVLEVSTGHTWSDTTVASGPRLVVQGEGQSYVVEVTPPAGFVVAPGQTLPDTVEVHQDSTVTVRLIPRGNPSAES